MKEALIYEKINKVCGSAINRRSARCLVCQRRCLIADGKVGFCQTKINRKGRLFSANYGLIQGIQIDPIEKKPFYHFRPGALVPSIGSYGCNFRCKQCLNWWCSWGEPAKSTLERIIAGNEASIVSPEELIEEIKKLGQRGVAFTYNEPTVWAEYVLDVARLAKKEKLFTVYVTNGSWTAQTLDKIGPYIDAANVDLKGFSAETYAKQGGFFGEIPEMLIYSQKKHQIFLEITTLLIPTINDDAAELRAMTSWMVKNLGPQTPWHLSQYDPKLAPDSEFQKIPYTPPVQLAEAAEIGRQAGLQFVYIWAPSSNYSQPHTYCPKCQNLAIQRTGYQIKILGVDKKGCCSACGNPLNIKNLV